MDKESLFYTIEAIQLANDIEPSLKITKFTNCMAKILESILKIVSTMPFHLKYYLRFIYDHTREEIGDEQASQIVRYIVYETLFSNYFQQRSRKSTLYVLFCRLVRRIIHYKGEDDDHIKLPEFLPFIQRMIKVKNYRQRFLEAVFQDMPCSNLDLYLRYDQFCDRHEVRAASISYSLYLHDFLYLFLVLEPSNVKGADLYCEYASNLIERNRKDYSGIMQALLERKKNHQMDNLSVIYSDYKTCCIPIAPTSQQFADVTFSFQ